MCSEPWDSNKRLEMCHIFKYPQEKIWGVFFPSGDLFAYPKKSDQCPPLRKAQNWTHVTRDSISHLSGWELAS